MLMLCVDVPIRDYASSRSPQSTKSPVKRDNGCYGRPMQSGGLYFAVGAGAVAEERNRHCVGCNHLVHDELNGEH